MHIRSFAVLPAVAMVVAAIWPVSALTPPASPSPSAAAWADESPLPTVRTHRYRMAGRVRPLLFWIGRDEVGLARVVWRGGAAGLRGYDLLVGTDPGKAPRRINRWGFIAERAAGPDGAVLAVMSKSDENSLGEAQASVAGGAGGVEFKAMRAVSRDGNLSWQVDRVQAPGELTIHDVTRLIDRVRAQTAAGSPRSRRVPDGTRPGFLVSVAELVDAAVAARAGSSSLDTLGAAVVPYVFGQQSYRLRMASVKPVSLDVPGRGGPVPGCASVFEILNVASGERTRFDMSFGTAGDLAGVPTWIAWQPRWWLKVELALVE